MDWKQVNVEQLWIRNKKMLSNYGLETSKC